MTFLVECTTFVYKWQYAMIEEFKKADPNARFVLLINANNTPEIKEYIAKKNVHLFEEIVDFKEYINRFEKDQKMLDMDLLKRFEQTLPQKSLWRLVAIDREWGGVFVKTAVRPLSYIRRINSRENILKVMQHLIQLYTRLFNQHHINVVLPSNGMNSVNSGILEQFARNYNAEYIVPETIRSLGHFSLSQNKEQNFQHVRPHYTQLLNDPLSDISVGEKMYDDMMEELRKQDFYDKLTLEQFRATPKFVYWARMPLMLAKVVVDWIIGFPKRMQTDTIFRQKNDWETFKGNLHYKFLRAYQIIKMMDDKFFSVYDPKCKYVYFALASTPEHSTQVKAPMWVDQRIIIEALSKSIPVDWIIYVKEHPQNLICRARELGFYDELKKYPNVRLIKPDSNFFDAIKNAQLIVNTTGTTGWQAIQYNKPLINFAENFYDMLDLSVYCSDIERLSVEIHRAVELSQEASEEERRRRIACLLTALRKHSLWVDHPWKLMGDIIADEKDSQYIGKAVAECIQGFLNERKGHKEKKDFSKDLISA